MKRGEKRLICDFGSELRLGGTYKKKGEDNKWDGNKTKRKKKRIQRRFSTIKILDIRLLDLLFRWIVTITPRICRNIKKIYILHDSEKKIALSTNLTLPSSPRPSVPQAQHRKQNRRRTNLAHTASVLRLLCAPSITNGHLPNDVRGLPPVF